MTSLVKIKQERLIKPNGNGILGRLAVTAGGIGIGYLLLPTVPLASIAIAGALALSYLQDADKTQHPATAKRLELLLHSKTAKHPSIYESRRELKAKYPMAAVNKAIEYMADHCEYVEFTPNSKHPLRVFGGELYCFIDPIDQEVLMPIDGLKKLMVRWELDDQPVDDSPTIDVNPITPGLDEGVQILPGNRETLINRLKTECPDLLKLIKSPPIRVVGLQRTGKSTFARKLALLRVVLLEGHTTSWSTPHREADNLVPDLLNPIGTTPTGAKDFSAIESHWVAIQQAIDKGQQLNLTAVWDEFGSYDAFEDENLLGKSLRSLLRESTKHGYFPILIAHGDQASFYPGVKNILGTLQQSTVKVETIGEQADDFGTMQPTGEVEITRLDGSVSRFKTPEWLTIDYLISMVRTNTKPSFIEPPAIADQVVKSPFDYRGKLEELFAASPNQNIEESVNFDVFEKLAASVNPTDPLFSDFILWMKTKQGQQLSKREMILLWGNKKERGLTSNEKIQPLIDKAISNTLLAENDSGYQVLIHGV